MHPLRRLGVRRVTQGAAMAAALAAALAPTTPARAAERSTCAAAARTTTVAYDRIAGWPASATSMDVSVPSRGCRAPGRRAPVVMWVHGGGYQIGDKAFQVADKRRLFTRRGWIFVSVNYRLSAPGAAVTARYPDHYRDVAAAVAWTRSHIAARGGDPKRIALLGHSAGADIVSNVTASPTWLRERGTDLRAVRCAGPLDTAGFDKTRVAPGGAEQAQWRAALGNNPAFATQTSATLLARRGSGIPPTTTVVRGLPLRRSIQTDYAARLRSLGVPTRVIDASGLSHREVNTRIGAAGDAVMTPPLLAFLESCWRGDPRR